MMSSIIEIFIPFTSVSEIKVFKSSSKISNFSKPLH